MRYIGSKVNLLEHIDHLVENLGVHDGVFCDMFAGTASVAAHFKRRGFQIISNDLLEVSYVFQRALIHNNALPTFEGIIDTIGDVSGGTLFDQTSPYHKVIAWLNVLPGKKGSIFQNYCPSGKNEYGRQYFSDMNGQKIDSVRQQIQAWYDAEEITEDEFYLLLLPLLEATSKVANISGTYGAYLKHWDPRTHKDLTLDPIPVIPSDVLNHVYRCDANKLVEEIVCDVLYLDPPYNTRQYITNYHVLETIARYDNPQLKGKTGLRKEDSAEKSAYCSKTACLDAFRDLIDKADAKYIVVSYNTEGILSTDEVLSVLNQRGDARLDSSIDYQRFKSNSGGSKATRVEEILFYVEVTTPPKRTHAGAEKEEGSSEVPTKRRRDPRNKLNDLTGSEWVYFLNSVELEEGELDLMTSSTLNDMSEEEWAEAMAPVLDTYYPTSGVESYAHHIRKQHPSPKPPQLMKRLIEFFTKKGGRVLDPFVGVGGTLLACSMTDRVGVGIDLSQEYLDMYHQASVELGLEPQNVFCGDSMKLGELFPPDEEAFDLLLTDPPYGDMLSRKRTGEHKKKTGDDSATPFTDSTLDLGNMEGKDFYRSLKEVIAQSMRLLKTKGYVVIFCKDVQPTKVYHNMIHADIVNALADIDKLQFRGLKIWYDKTLKLYPFGYPYAYVSNQLHQYILIFRKEP
ncbi:DNA adenine methylase [Candidatus Poribacteria bacterium]|nr:DNA adenine methylase [Candidatus Poribacteria bacterium]